MRLLLTIILVTLSWSVSASDYKEEIQKFFSLYESNKKIAAVDSIYSTNPWMSSAADSIQNIKMQFQGIEKLVGKYNGKELIDELNIKNRFVHVTYLALYDRQPVRMEFQFYKPRNNWIIYSFSFDIEFDDEVEAGARKRIANQP